MNRSFISNREYYDKFSLNYEKERRKGYHALVDELEIDLVGKYCKNAKVLEAGCGTGILLNSVKKIASHTFGLDISDKMLKIANTRGLNCIQGNISSLPFKNNVFDAVYSFKVLAHVHEIRDAISEVARVLKKNGYLILEFYNPYSLRRILKIIKSSSKTSNNISESDVFTRYDSLKSIKELLPPSMEIKSIRGIRIFTPTAHVYKVPFLKKCFSLLERKTCDTIFRYFAGFLTVVLKYKNEYSNE